MANPAQLIWSWDIARTDAFYFTFGDYIPALQRDSSSLRLTEYHFPYFDLKGLLMSHKKLYHKFWY